jgi:AcrR family transcriptional regulator
MASKAGKPAVNKSDDPGSTAWQRRKNHRQAEILLAARKLIEEEGAARTSMLRIATAAGVSEATLYKYFDSKQDLVNQVLREWARPFLARIAVELEHVTDLRSRLVLIAVRFLGSFDETPALNRVFFQELRWSNYRGSPIHRLSQQFTDTVITTIKAGIRDGEVRPDADPALLRDMLFGGLEHIGLRTSLAGRPADVGSVATACVDMVLFGALVRPQGRDMPDELARLAALIDRLEHASS